MREIFKVIYKVLCGKICFLFSKLIIIPNPGQEREGGKHLSCLSSQAIDHPSWALNLMTVLCGDGREFKKQYLGLAQNRESNERCPEKIGKG